MAAGSVAAGVAAAPAAAIAGNRHLFLEGILPCYYYYQIHSQARIGLCYLSSTNSLSFSTFFVDEFLALWVRSERAGLRKELGGNGEW